MWSIFVLALTVCEILKFQACDVQNLGQGHDEKIETYAIRWLILTTSPDSSSY